jgi:heat shock protein HtpX
MARAKISIAPKRSVALYALLAMTMVAASYLVVLLVAAACVYLPVLAITEARSAPFQLVVLLFGGIAVAGAMLWSLVPRRVKFEAPGLLLERSEHPLLFREIEEIAGALDEPLPREVYLIGPVNAFVADRGGAFGFGSRRILAIGLPLLSILNISEIRGILAHEFAHYYSGDTRMGPWVYRAQTAMIRTFQNVESVGGKVGRQVLVVLMYFVVAFILKWNFLFFLRVSNFVSRKKEFRADELACLVAGREAVMHGLRKTHEAAMAWQEYWNTEVAPVLQNGCIPPIGDGLARFLAAPQIAEQVTRGIERELAERKTNPYETHPPLRDRLEAIETIAAEPQEQNGEPALSLLSDPGSVELRFLESVNPKLEKGSLRHVNWNEVGPMVTIPAWKSAVREYAVLLEGISAESIFEAAKNLSAMGARIRDPKGMLLTPEQRRQRAAHLLGVALGLALLEKDWQLEAEPANFYLHRGSERLNVFDEVQKLAHEKLAEGEWVERCKEWGVAGVALWQLGGVDATGS